MTIKQKLIFAAAAAGVLLILFFSGVLRHLRSPQGDVYVKKTFISGFDDYSMSRDGVFHAKLKNPANLPAGFLHLTVYYLNEQTDSVTAVMYIEDIIPGRKYRGFDFSRKELISVERDNRQFYKESDRQFLQHHDSLAPAFGKFLRARLNFIAGFSSSSRIGPAHQDSSGSLTEERSIEQGTWDFRDGKISGTAYPYIYMTKDLAYQLQAEGVLSLKDTFYSDNDDPGRAYRKTVYSDWTDLITSLKE